MPGIYLNFKCVIVEPVGDRTKYIIGADTMLASRISSTIFQKDHFKDFI